MSRTVLYIEDDANNVRLMERILGRREGTTLATAATGRDGVNTAIDAQPALILLDNRLPDATGAEVLRQLGSNQATAGIPVIVITGDVDQATADRLLVGGAAEIITKPFDIHQFMASLDHYL